MSIYRCLVLTELWKFARFRSVKNKAHVNAFPYIAVLFSHHIPLRLLSVSRIVALASAWCPFLDCGRGRIHPTMVT